MTDTPDTQPEYEITYKHVGLTISGMVYVEMPAGSFQTHPDEPVQLCAALEHAMKKCGLGDNTDAGFIEIGEFCRPFFKKAVTKFESIRLDVLKKCGRSRHERLRLARKSSRGEGKRP